VGGGGCARHREKLLAGALVPQQTCRHTAARKLVQVQAQVQVQVQARRRERALTLLPLTHAVMVAVVAVVALARAPHEPATPRSPLSRLMEAAAARSRVHQDQKPPHQRRMHLPSR